VQFSDYTVAMDAHGRDAITLGTHGISGQVQLIVNAQHLRQVVREGMLTAKASIVIATADFKAMLVPGSGRQAPSIVEYLVRLAKRGVEVRLMHASVPSSAALRQLKRELPDLLTIRRCPRLHAKAVVIDTASMYLGSANLTGAGLGAKSDGRRNFEWGIWTQSTALIDAVMQNFNDLWEGKQCIGCQRKDICPVPLEEPRL
jgi:phosphatidylserine/phosphatidylglycerophosphate/cardiolipin synthase-like enzyme